MSSIQGGIENNSRIGILVDHNPAIWLPGPVNRSKDEWLYQAHKACIEDFNVIRGSQEDAYLHEVLTLFVNSEMGPGLRFLLLRNVVDLPTAVTVAAATGSVAVEMEDHFASLDPDATYYDPHARVETIDSERSLRRAIAFEVQNVGLRSIVRYHRAVPEWNAAFVLSSAGGDLRSTALTLRLMDDLARSVWFINEHGVRR